ncbi:metalloregulator ArsR/SmtB family transcription factor [Leucobacter sp. wl10]|uniref:metalloregulator ArsR/SmtB family transcription factor n=1 Tax=Leucobacter sp. wl10 TaxID=2304677 RepID=UPI000E5BD498|nr:metalloregulator ArsR/SmtB family transcription factor [Leucobacter sp. wl10]RGE20345.1 ArsR family transcriptional regulator [Leucobacter sp. wl10]
MNDQNTNGLRKADVFDVFAEVTKAMANGRRLELLELMAQGEHSVEDLANLTGMGMTTTSAHLQSLKRAGLVQTRRRRTTIFYRLAADDVAELYTAAKRVALARNSRLRDTVQAYMSEPRAEGPTIDPAAVTSDMLVVDVRPKDEFDSAHFPGAISIPLAELEDRYTEIPAEAEVVLYCRGEFCRLSREAAVWLRERGLDAKSMDEGIVEWRATKEIALDAT